MPHCCMGIFLGKGVGIQVVKCSQTVESSLRTSLPTKPTRKIQQKVSLLNSLQWKKHSSSLVFQMNLAVKTSSKPSSYHQFYLFFRAGFIAHGLLEQFTALKNNLICFVRATEGVRSFTRNSQKILFSSPFTSRGLNCTKQERVVILSCIISCFHLIGLTVNGLVGFVE